MPGTFDLDIDTHWIRRAADSMDVAARALGAAAANRPLVALPAGSLGGSGTAAAVLLLVNVRNGQAHDAAAQLQAVAGAIGQQLLAAAVRFEHTEAAIAMPTR